MRTCGLPCADEAASNTTLCARAGKAKKHAVSMIATLDRSGRDVVGGASSFSNVDQTTPTGTVASNSGTDNLPNVKLASAVNEIVLDVVAADKDANSLSVGPGQTQRWNRNPGDVYGGGSTEPGAATVGMTWTLGSSDPWGILAVAIKPSTVTADLTVVKSVNIYDPAAMGLRALPGEDVIYTLQVTNAGDAVNTDTVFVIDAIPADMTFYNDDMDDGGPATGPVYFIDGGSGLTCCLATDSDSSSSTMPPPVFGYVPTVGYDPNIHFIRINPKGAMNPGGSPDPTFSLQFRARIN